MLEPPAPAPPATVIGRYTIHAEIAHGGMATIHLGRLTGPVGFARTVAIKRLHPMFAKDPEFVAMFMDEARLAARIQHPNVVSIIDVVAEQGELLLVMDYIQGESLSRLLRAERQRTGRIDLRIIVKIMTEVLSGLHAAHEVTNERGTPLGVVHRDVSPQNILVGIDGVAQLIDFGVAKAAGRVQSTQKGQLKGKLAYMAPEQLRSGIVDRRTDVYAAAVVLWEAIVGRRLFQGDEGNLLYGVLTAPIQAPSALAAEGSAVLDDVVMKGLQRNASRRFGTAREMADALESALAPASSREVARWMEELSSATLEQRAKLVAEVESLSHFSVPPPVLGAPEVPTDMSGASWASAALRAANGQPTTSHETGPGDAIAALKAEPETLSTDTGSTISSALIVGSPRPAWPRWVGIGVGVAILAVAIWIVRGKPAVPAASPTAIPSNSSMLSIPTAVESTPLVDGPEGGSASPSPSASATSHVQPQATVPVVSTSRPPRKTAEPMTTTSPPAGSTKKPPHARD